MKFQKINLLGFKSFVEKTSFFIEDGLTGIVGPNGCGKSNIVESLRWCMGETSAKSMRGSGMEDVIFSGTANKPSKNIAEVTITIDNSEKDSPLQYKDSEEINIRRKIQKDKGSKYHINEKEVRARDAQTFFADLSTGAHSPSIISQGRIGALVTAKPTDRRIILEEAAGISGIHARRHESELRLSSAENNLKRADELKKQQEKQLENLKKQAEEASKYKLISDEIKKIEAGLYYLKLKELESEFKITSESIDEADNEISGLKIDLNHKDDLLEEENSKLKPLRDKNIEILSKLQRLNLELKNLEEEEVRNKNEKEKLLLSISTIETDLEREKNMIINASSNVKRLDEEQNNLIDKEKKYYELEKQTEQDLKKATQDLNEGQEKLKNYTESIISSDNNKDNINFLNLTLEQIINSKQFFINKDQEKGLNEIDNIIKSIESKIKNIGEKSDKNLSKNITELTTNIKNFQENYAITLSKNESVKNDSAKRKERIKGIDIEIDNWKNLKLNSDKMEKELTDRINNIKKDLLKLDLLPESIAIKKGQSMQKSSTTEVEKKDLSDELEKAEHKFNEINNSLKLVQENMSLAREKRARFEATAEGLKNRKKDLLERANEAIGLNENDLLKFSDLHEVEVLPDALQQEEKLDKKKRIRESLGSVNLRADVETEKFKENINKMEKDRKDLVDAILKLRTSINELNQKGRERLLEAFEIVNVKFNQVYTKLFNGGSAKLELIDSEDPLEAGLEMLVSPPGKRLQSITLLSGGEQALTALSLIFAVFLTSPSPICILDEVDAPLDDANVTRFCSLLNDLTKITQTKFVIITHHSLTMSKMDRLYGVTMPDRGVSQLVAVDLQKAEELVA